MNEATIDWAARDAKSAQVVLAMAPEQSDTLPTLTDEEIVALDGIDRDQFVALPFLSEHTDQRRLICTVALRSLMSKGLAVPVTDEGEDSPSRLDAAQEITGIMTLRRTGRRVISAERTAANGQFWLYGYLHGTTVLEERVNDGGVHDFSIYPTAQLIERIAQLADPEGAAAGNGQSREFTEAGFAAQAPQVLGDIRAVTVVTGIGVETEKLSNVTVYTGIAAVHCLHSGTESPDAAPAASVTIAPVSAETLRAGLAAVISGS